MKFNKHLRWARTHAAILVVIAFIVVSARLILYAGANTPDLEPEDSQTNSPEVIDTVSITVETDALELIESEYVTETAPESVVTTATELVEDTTALPTVEEATEAVVETEPEPVYEEPEPEYAEPEPVYDEPEAVWDISYQIQLTESERRDFAALIMLESQGESMECKKAVASVVINRMQIDGVSLRDVLYAPGQFEPAPYISSTVPSEDCYTAVDYVCANGPTIPPYVTFFRADYHFSWAIPYIVIDHTYFSYTSGIYERVVNG